MRTTIIIVRVVYVVMMAIFLLLIVTDSISGYSTVLMTLMILAVIGLEQILRRKVKTNEH